MRTAPQEPATRGPIAYMATLTYRTREEIRVGANGGARCTRRYTIVNNTVSPAKIPPILKIELDRDVRITNVYSEDGRPSNFLPTKGTYHTGLSVEVAERQLEVGACVTLVIEYEWPDFIPGPAEPVYSRQLRLSHEFGFEYELEIGCVDTGLLASPVFGVLPITSRFSERPVIPTAEGTYIVRTRNVPPRTALTITMTGGSRKVELPVLNTLAAAFSPSEPFRGVAVLFIQHLLNDFLAVLRAFERCGLEARNTFVVGIPYSSKDDIVQILSYEDRVVEAPATYHGGNFLHAVQTMLDAVFVHCQKRDLQYVVVEDGGYVTRLLRDRVAGNADWGSRCVGIVEQTTNGIWVTRDWQNNPGSYSSSLSLPVYNVAESSLKRDGEAPLIGKAVVFNTMRLLERYEESNLSEKVALVLGHGSIGSEVVKALVSEKCNVVVWESEQARAKDLPPGVVLAHDLEEACNSADLVIGCTGKGVNTPNDGDRPPLNERSNFLALKHGAVLVNGSSKLCEFNWEEVDNITKVQQVSRAFGHERILNGGKLLRVAADGFPVNFYNSQSAPAEKMQPILAMLFLGACRLLEKTHSPGIVDVPDEDQEYIMRVYRESNA